MEMTTLMKVDIAFLPKDTTKMDLADTVCIVLDIFRATSSIVTAFANRCNTIIPVYSVEDATHIARQIGPVLLAGERKSIRIDCFDFGNSPSEFSSDKVKGQTIIMTTTNGTVAIRSTERAHSTLIGSFLNSKAVCQQAIDQGKDILIVCAGTDGFFSLEDALCAGLLVRLLADQDDMHLTDSARCALLMYEATKIENKLTQAAVKSRNGKRLYDMNLTDDILYCLQTDKFNIVPHYTEGKILVN